MFELPPTLVNKRIWVSLHKASLHPWKLTCPQKRDYFSREYIFQPLIFRRHSLVFRGVTLKNQPKPPPPTPKTSEARSVTSGPKSTPPPRGLGSRPSWSIGSDHKRSLGNPPTRVDGPVGRWLRWLMIWTKGDLCQKPNKICWGICFFFGWVVGWFMVLSLGLSWTHVEISKIKRCFAVG